MVIVKAERQEIDFVELPNNVAEVIVGEFKRLDMEELQYSNSSSIRYCAYKAGTLEIM